MSIACALERMAEFASRTGLAPGSPHAPRRYLWTDAFAVCSLLELARVTGDRAHQDMALRLVDQVHDVLGRPRDGSARLGDADDRHPTRGGLRIGKPLPERAEDEPFDARLEWERDGQYFHYLTKWMHALDRAARETGRAELNLWARELAKVAYVAFTREVSDDDTPRIAWKMSIDLSRPLVASMGHHDALDGLVTYVQLQDGADVLGSAHEGPDLEDAIRGFQRMLVHADWVTDDALGIGGLLTDACRVQQLSHRVELGASDLVLRLLASAFIGLRQWAGHTDLRRTAGERLAFRELGLCLGLHAVETICERDDLECGDAGVVVDALARFVPLSRTLEAFWRDPEHRSDALRDIDDVMLATSLLPGGFLRLGAQSPGASGSAVAMPQTPATPPASSSSGLT